MMPTLISATTGASAYLALLRRILRDGEPTSPRGRPTLELRNTMVTIAQPWRAVPTGVGREINVRIGYAESAQLLAGISCLWQLDKASRGRFSQYSDDGNRLAGAYGPRVYCQMEKVIMLLASDPDTRQAHVAIFRRGEKGKDVPCTIGVGFAVRNGLLDMDVHMRSNDAFLGAPYDWWQFSRLQMAVAWALGRPAGTYSHFVNSMHLYDIDRDRVFYIANKNNQPVSTDDDPGVFCPVLLTERMIVPTPMRDVKALKRWQLVTDTAYYALAHINPGFASGPGSMSPGYDAIAEAVHAWPADHRLCMKCRYVLPVTAYAFHSASAICERCQHPGQE